MTEKHFSSNIFFNLKLFLRKMFNLALHFFGKTYKNQYYEIWDIFNTVIIRKLWNRKTTLKQYWSEIGLFTLHSGSASCSLMWYIGSKSCLPIPEYFGFHCMWNGSNQLYQKYKFIEMYIGMYIVHWKKTLKLCS